MTEQIIVSPERLQAISKQLAARGEIHQQNLATLRSELSSLLGRWKGDAANAHRSEMEQLVFPAFQRLIDALNHGAQVVQATMQNFEEAQVEGEKPLKQLAEVASAEYKAAAQNGAAGDHKVESVVQPSNVDAPTSNGGGADSGGTGGGGTQGGGSSGGGGNPSSGGNGPQALGAQGKGASSGSQGASLSNGSSSGDANGSGVPGGPVVAPVTDGANSTQAAFAAIGLAAAAGAKKVLDKRNE